MERKGESKSSCDCNGSVWKKTQKKHNVGDVLKMKKTMLIIIIFLLIIVIFIVVGKRIFFPKYDEIEVTGKYEIGCEDYWVTENKEDPFFKNGSPREVQVRVWYPKDNDAPDMKLPVVIASHGSCGTIDNNRSLYREFASHGYVVLAVSHPGHAFDTLHSNGKKQKVSMDYMKEMGGMNPQEKTEEAAKLFAEWMELRMTDLSAVMDDFVEKSKQIPDRFESADTSRFVTLGHSAGGSAALGMARIRADVVGVSALESPCMYDIKGVKDGEYIMDDSEYEIPILNVYSDASYSHLHEWKQYRNNVKFLESEKGYYENIYYEGVGHMGLCDLSLASPILAGMLDQTKSKVEPREQLKRLNTDCLDFLQRLSLKKG